MSDTIQLSNTLYWGMDGDTLKIILQALGFVVATIVALSQVANRMPRSKTRLKNDLEIMKMLGEDDPKYPVVRAHVDHSIRQIFESNIGKDGRIHVRFKIHNLGTFIFGVVLLFGGLVWTLFLVQDGFSWWSILTGFIALAGFGNIMNGFEEKRRPESTDTT